MAITIIIALLSLWLLPNVIGLLLFLFSKKDRAIIYKHAVIVFDTKIWFLPTKFSWVAGITFGNFIFLKYENDFKIDDNFFVNYRGRKYISNQAYRQLINHELTHTIQQLIFGGFFYIIYLLDFIQGYYKSGDWRWAYLNIYFEKQARQRTIMEDIYYYRAKIMDISINVKNTEKRIELMNEISNKIKLLEGLIRKER